MSTHRAFIFAAKVGILFLVGWVISCFWGWFLVPVLSVPTITLLEGSGLRLLVHVLTWGGVKTNELARFLRYKRRDEREFKRVEKKALLFEVLSYLTLLGLGYFFHLLMT